METPPRKQTKFSGKYDKNLDDSEPCTSLYCTGTPSKSFRLNSYEQFYTDLVSEKSAYDHRVRQFYKQLCQLHPRSYFHQAKNEDYRTGLPSQAPSCKSDVEVQYVNVDVLNPDNPHAK